MAQDEEAAGAAQGKDKARNLREARDYKAQIEKRKAQYAYDSAAVGGDWKGALSAAKEIVGAVQKEAAVKQENSQAQREEERQELIKDRRTPDAEFDAKWKSTEASLKITANSDLRKAQSLVTAAAKFAGDAGSYRLGADAMLGLLDEAQQNKWEQAGARGGMMMTMAGELVQLTGDQKEAKSLYEKGLQLTIAAEQDPATRQGRQRNWDSGAGRPAWWPDESTDK